MGEAPGTNRFLKTVRALSAARRAGSPGIPRQLHISAHGRRAIDHNPFVCWGCRKSIHNTPLSSTASAALLVDSSRTPSSLHHEANTCGRRDCGTDGLGSGQRPCSRQCTMLPVVQRLPGRLLHVYVPHVPCVTTLCDAGTCCNGPLTARCCAPDADTMTMGVFNHSKTCEQNCWGHCLLMPDGDTWSCGREMCGPDPCAFDAASELRRAIDEDARRLRGATNLKSSHPIGFCKPGKAWQVVRSSWDVHRDVACVVPLTLKPPRHAARVHAATEQNRRHQRRVLYSHERVANTGPEGTARAGAETRAKRRRLRRVCSHGGWGVAVCVFGTRPALTCCTCGRCASSKALCFGCTPTPMTSSTTCAA